MPDFSAVPGHLARIFIDEFELTQQSSGAEFNAELNTETYELMGQPTAQQYVSTPSYSIPHHGYYTGHGAQPNLGYFEEVLYARLGTATPVTVTLQLGPVAYTMIGTWGSQLNIDAPVEGLITIDGNWSSPDQLIRGTASPSADYTSGMNGEPIDLGAAGVANGVIFHVSGFTTGSVTVKLQTATTAGGTYTDWAGMTWTFAAPGAKLVTGVVNPAQFARLVVTFSGTPGPISAFANIKSV